MPKEIQERIKKIRFGVDYYPEHWPKERWETDAQLMEELGIQTVRMAEFAWNKMEPREGEYVFDWLDEAIQLMGEHGIYTVLGTPTAAPPAWMIEKHPEILPIDSKGQQKGFGGRHHDCQSNPLYRTYIRKLVTAMAGHYKENPFVVAWQIDNELGNSHEDLCMCESCRNAFARWLEKKYGTIQALNEAWGTVFWSQTYDNFRQIPAPRQTPTTHNPSLLLNWKRFCSDLVVDFHKMQAEIIKKIAPHQKVTHNLMGFYDKTDYFKMSEDLDFAANDQYPTGYYFDPPGQGPAEVAACMDFIRSVKGKNFWMMELQSGPTGGSVIGANPKPGQNRLWTAQCVAHGADAIVYFRWRTCLFGAEQFWHGILPHQGVPKRRYYEIFDTIRQLAPVMEDINGIVTKGDAAILFSYEEDWAIQLQPQHPKLSYTGTVLKYYGQMYQRNLLVDFLPPEGDFSEYPVLIAPLLYLMNPELEQRLMDYAKQGGVLVLTMRTGVMNMDNVCMSQLPLPGVLGEIAGVEVEEYDCLLGRTASVSYGEQKGTAEKWCDILLPVTAETLVSYDSDYYKGKAAVTVNRFGRGLVYYVGTELDDNAMEWLFDQILYGKGSGQAENLTKKGLSEKHPAVELAVRKGAKKDYLFVLNHSSEEQRVKVQDFWSREEMNLEPFGVCILEKEHH